jgi:NADH dehydrogenase FAD-containing subunit
MTPTLSSRSQTIGHLPINVVLIGSGNITLGAYKSLVMHLRSAILSGKVQLILVSAGHYHTCYGWMMECITEIVEYENLMIPLSDCFKHALHVSGNLVSIDPEAKQLQVIEETGQTITIHYDHLLAGDEYFTETLQNNKTACGFTIQSSLDMLKTRQQLVFLTERAALAKDRFSASRILRVAIVGDGVAGVELASNICAYLMHLCTQYKIAFVKPTLYLVINNRVLVESRVKASRINEYITRQLEDIGVRIIYNKRVIRVNPDGAALDDGSFINCSIVYCTNHTPEARFKITDSFCVNGSAQPELDIYGRVKAYTNAWMAGTYHDDILPNPSQYIDKVNEGRRIGKNMARAIKKRPLSTSKPRFTSSVGSLDAGKGFAVVSGIRLTGWAGFCLRVVFLLYYMPALQRSACIRNWISFFIWKREKKSSWRSFKRTPASDIQYTRVAI